MTTNENPVPAPTTLVEALASIFPIGARSAAPVDADDLDPGLWFDDDADDGYMGMDPEYDYDDSDHYPSYWP